METTCIGSAVKIVIALLYLNVTCSGGMYIYAGTQDNISCITFIGKYIFWRCTLWVSNY